MGNRWGHKKVRYLGRQEPPPHSMSKLDDLYRLHRLLDGRRTPSPARPCTHACKRLGESQKRSDTLRKKCIARSIGRARIEMENRAERTPRRKEKRVLKA